MFRVCVPWLATMCFGLGVLNSSVHAKNEEIAHLPQFRHFVSKSAPTKRQLFTFNTVIDATNDLILNPGSALPFNNVPFIKGDAVKQLSSTSFKLRKAGAYLISLTASVNAPTGTEGSLRLRVNGNLVGPEIPTAPAGGAIVLEQILKISRPVTIQFIATQSSVRFKPGDSALLNVVQLRKK